MCRLHLLSWRSRKHTAPKHRYHSTKLHVVILQKTEIFIGLKQILYFIVTKSASFPSWETFKNTISSLTILIHVKYRVQYVMLQSSKRSSCQNSKAQNGCTITKNVKNCPDHSSLNYLYYIKLLIWAFCTIMLRRPSVLRWPIYPCTISLQKSTCYVNFT